MTDPIIEVLKGYRRRGSDDELLRELKLVAREHGIDPKVATQLCNGPLAWTVCDAYDIPKRLDELCAEARAQRYGFGRAERGRLGGRGLELLRLWARERHGLEIAERPGRERCPHCGRWMPPAG